MCLNHLLEKDLITVKFPPQILIFVMLVRVYSAASSNGFEVEARVTLAHLLEY